MIDQRSVQYRPNTSIDKYWFRFSDMDDDFRSASIYANGIPNESASNTIRFEVWSRHNDLFSEKKKREIVFIVVVVVKLLSLNLCGFFFRI